MSIFSHMLGFVFPEKCVGCANRGEIFCNSCRKTVSSLHPKPHPDFASILPYQHPIVKRALRAIKFKRTRDIAIPIGEIAYQAFVEDLAEIVEMYRDIHIYVLPVPLSRERQRERGFNQSELIAKSFASRDPHLVVRNDILVRTKHSLPQSSIKLRRERMENVVGAFALAKPDNVRGKIVIILDDIATTGATLGEIKKVLKPAKPKKIILLAVAH